MSYTRLGNSFVQFFPGLGESARIDKRLDRLPRRVSGYRCERWGAVR